MASLTLSAFPSPSMASISCSKREQKKAYSQQLFNNRALGEVSSQASLSVGFILKFLLNFSDSILATSSDVCTVDWAFQWGFSLAGPSNFWAHTHSWLQKWAKPVHLSCSKRLVGTVTTTQIDHGCSTSMLVKGALPYLVPTDCHQNFSLFLWDESSSRGLGSREGGALQSPSRTPSKAPRCAAKGSERMSPSSSWPCISQQGAPGHSEGRNSTHIQGEP